MVSLPVLISQVTADYGGAVPPSAQKIIQESRTAIETENTILKIGNVERQIQVLRQKYVEAKAQAQQLLKQNKILQKIVERAAMHSRRLSSPKEELRQEHKRAPLTKEERHKTPKTHYVPSNKRKIRFF